MSTITTTTRTDAEEYNARIAQALRTAEAVAEYINGYQAGTQDSEDPVTELLDGTNIDRAEFLAAVCEFDDLDDADPADALDRYFYGALLVEATGKHSNGEWTVTGVDVTITSGGPSTWIEWDGNGKAVTVRTAWGSDRASEVVWAPTLVSIMDSYCDTVAAEDTE
jgi:hypothetical protein